MAAGIITVAAILAGLTIISNVAAAFTAATPLILVTLISILTPVMWVLAMCAVCFTAAKTIEVIRDRSKVAAYREKERARQIRAGLNMSATNSLAAQRTIPLESHRLDEVKR